MESTARSELLSLMERHLGLAADRGGIATALENYARRKVRALGLEHERELVALLVAGKEPLDELIEAVTIPHTWFFRDLEQLQEATELMIARGARRDGPAQIWVPACASGEDAYSLAALAHERHQQIEVLGSDVNAAVLQLAQAGIYGSWSTREVPERLRNMLAIRADGRREIVAEARRAVRFQRQNLLEKPPRSNAPDGRWNLVVCRNILIYLTRENVRRAIENLKESLADDGVLILGASDILLEFPAGLVPVERKNRLAFVRQESHAAQDPPLHIRVTNQIDAALRLAESLPLPTPAPAAMIQPEPPVARERQSPSQEEEGDTSLALAQMHGGIRSYLQGDVQTAARELRAALFLDAELWPAAYYLALCCDALGQAREAKRLFARVAELIAAGVSLPESPEQSFRFVEQDVLRIARERAHSTPNPR